MESDDRSGPDRPYRGRRRTGQEAGGARGAFLMAIDYEALFRTFLAESEEGLDSMEGLLVELETSTIERRL